MGGTSDHRVERDETASTVAVAQTAVIITIPGKGLDKDQVNKYLFYSAMSSGHRMLGQRPPHGLSAVVLTNMSGEALLYHEGLKRRAGRVHRAAQLVHVLD